MRDVVLVVLVAVVAVGASAYFRRHSYSFAGRIVLALVALGLMLVDPIRRGSITSGEVGLFVVAAVLLGGGIFYLWRTRKGPPE